MQGEMSVAYCQIFLEWLEMTKQPSPRFNEDGTALEESVSFVGGQHEREQ